MEKGHKEKDKKEKLSGNSKNSEKKWVKNGEKLRFIGNLDEKREKRVTVIH